MLNNMNKQKIKTLPGIFAKPLFWVSIFVLITAFSAQIAVPVEPVPFTLQTAMVILSGAFLGARYGALSQVMYLAIGVIGFPVFANGFAGPAVLFGPTGGYLLAFPIGAFITGYIIEKFDNYLGVVIAMFLGEIAVIIMGALYLDAFYLHELSRSMQLGGAIFSIWAVVKVLGASTIYFGIKKSTK